MDERELENGLAQYGTPLYVFDLDQVSETVERYREILNNSASLCYAMKTNPFLTEQIQHQVDHIEVCSMGEFRICKELKIKPEKLVISGVLKKEEDIREILEYCHGRCIYTVESVNQFCSFVKWSEEHHEVLSLYLRLSSGNQFGMDEETIENLVMSREMYPYLSIKGIHFFSGTQKKKMKIVQKELEYLDGFLIGLEEKSKIIFDELEYGPGVSFSYFEKQDNHTMEDMELIADFLHHMKWMGNVTLEMGRAFAANCGYYLTTVRDVKQTNGQNYCIVDGGIHQVNYDGQIRGMYLPKYQMISEHDVGEPKEWKVCGALCTGNDVLLQKAEVKNLKIGDVFVFENTGAYSMTEGMALFLSHALPKVATYSKEMKWNLLREKISTYKLNM